MVGCEYFMKHFFTHWNATVKQNFLLFGKIQPMFVLDKNDTIIKLNNRHILFEWKILMQT